MLDLILVKMCQLALAAACTLVIATASESEDRSFDSRSVHVQSYNAFVCYFLFIVMLRKTYD
jgi:hypothetical protein